MKPDIYLGGEKQDYLGYRVPKRLESFFSEKQVITLILMVSAAMVIAQVFS